MFSELILDVADIAHLAQDNPEEFALLRRKGFGASDSSVILGVNHWTDITTLIQQKNLTYVTPEEMLIHNKPQVRMGSDLEPMILDKTEPIMCAPIEKPAHQYRFKDFPWLTVNYDGVVGFDDEQDFMICEAKCVSMYARKYWDWSKGARTAEERIHLPIAQIVRGKDFKDTVNKCAEAIGIPNYYYTQVQQQLIGTKKSLAYLCALDVNNWEVVVFPVLENEEVQQMIIALSRDAAEMCNEIPLEIVQNAQ
jgi:predicted phage-related endonuclease